MLNYTRGNMGCQSEVYMIVRKLGRVAQMGYNAERSFMVEELR
jgi:hypothetical protein